MLYTYKFYTVAVWENAILEVKAVQKLKNAVNTWTREPGFNDKVAYKTSAGT